MKRSLPALLVSLTLVTGFALAKNAPSAHDVKISQCSAKLPAPSKIETAPDASGHVSTTMSTTMESGTGLTIAFTNMSDQTMTGVDFVFGTPTRRIAAATENGTFEPGVSVKRRSALPSRVSVVGIGNATCTVTAIRYADGTSWHP